MNQTNQCRFFLTYEFIEERFATDEALIQISGTYRTAIIILNSSSGCFVTACIGFGMAARRRLGFAVVFFMRDTKMKGRFMLAKMQ